MMDFRSTIRTKYKLHSLPTSCFCSISPTTTQRNSRESSKHCTHFKRCRRKCATFCTPVTSLHTIRFFQCFFVTEQRTSHALKYKPLICSHLSTDELNQWFQPGVTTPTGVVNHFWRGRE